MPFRIRGLAAEPFAHLFALTDAELAAQARCARSPTGRIRRISLTERRRATR